MNPYQPADDDESQLDRIERKHRIEGWCLLALLIGALITGTIELLVEIVSARWKF
jgi:hypothetical protein